MASTTPPPWEDGDWELRTDGGFIYKRHKRRTPDPPPPEHRPDPDPAAAATSRREWKRKALLKLRDRYQREIDQWEYLSNTLRSMEETTRQLRVQRGQTASPLDDSSTSVAVPVVDSACSSAVDDLILQVEAREEIIKQASNLCDVAEAMCNIHEEEGNQTLMDLPIWAAPNSPRKLLASLCDP